MSDFAVTPERCVELRSPIEYVIPLSACLALSACSNPHTSAIAGPKTLPALGLMFAAAFWFLGRRAALRSRTRWWSRLLLRVLTAPRGYWGAGARADDVALRSGCGTSPTYA